jgi:hypothetical protein
MNSQPLVNQLRIASPCRARWEDMAGDQRARFCGQCRKHVFNLSAMTAVEIEGLVRDTEGRFCGRFFQRADGTVLTADCPSSRRLRRSRLARLGSGIVALFLFFFGLRATVRSQETSKPSVKPAPAKSVALLGEMIVPPPLMGKIAVPTNRPSVKTNSPVPTPRGK